MVLPDVNVLIYAFRPDAKEHKRHRQWLESAVGGTEVYGMSDLVLSSVVRIVTNTRAYTRPSSLEDTLNFARFLKSRPNCVQLQPESRHWSIFDELCRSLGVRGNLISDCYLAALAIEHGCEWITTDRHFSRFPGLRSRHPFD
jgi:toxin-antitoxin system PIN domain toxin